MKAWRSKDRWLSRSTPTADIYFLNAVGRLVSPRGPIVPLGPTVYACHDVYVVLRYATEHELFALEAASPDRVYYVIDDDFGLIQSDPDIPQEYRERVGQFARRLLPRILRLNPVVLAPNQLILDTFPDHGTLLLHPSLNAVRQQFDHFGAGNRINLVFSGTRSHLADLEVVAPAIEQLCARFPNVSFTAFLGRDLPGNLRALPNVLSRPAMPWPRFRQHLASASYHIAIAPFRRVPVNECRSHNKVHDHAALGAAGLYGDIRPYREAVTHGEDGLLLPSDPAIWFEHLNTIVSDPRLARRLAENGAALSQRIGDPSALRSFWLERLSLPTNDRAS